MIHLAETINTTIEILEITTTIGCIITNNLLITAKAETPITIHSMFQREDFIMRAIQVSGSYRYKLKKIWILELKI